ncbi:vancomycin high temperature exclusion protein [Embleya sp. NBC_00896]|uniref:SanA/YdcF family protein n=1 Tax=Embleya sp. NBC_00896 TaxID=2975961 RepID=UPI003868108F|nr:YdcF family protein [Embleya sp. NBC_00896]
MDVILRRPTLPRTRRAQRRGYQAAVLLAVAGLAPATWLHLYAGNRVRTVADVPPVDVTMVLGAGVDGDRPSDLLARRLDVALELYRAGRTRVILVSGDGGGNRYDETKVMRRYLADRGIPQTRIVTDESGFSTWESCVRAKRVYGLDRAIVVTQSFHLRRALGLCRAAGLDAYGVADESLTWGHLGPTVYGSGREMFAAIKATGQIVLKPDPRVNSPESDEIRRALNG